MATHRAATRSRFTELHASSQRFEARSDRGILFFDLRDGFESMKNKGHA